MIELIDYFFIHEVISLSRETIIQSRFSLVRNSLFLPVGKHWKDVGFQRKSVSQKGVSKGVSKNPHAVYILDIHLKHHLTPTPLN